MYGKSCRSPHSIRKPNLTREVNKAPLGRKRDVQPVNVLTRLGRNRLL